MRLQRMFVLVVVASLVEFVSLMQKSMESETFLDSEPPYPLTTNTGDSARHVLAHSKNRRRRRVSLREAKSTAGGVILNVHVVKTGGTTIRDHFSNTTLFPRVQYITVHTLKEFRAVKVKIDDRLQAVPPHNNTLFVELHGHNTPTLLDLEPMIQDWRIQAKAQNVSFFSFTLLRDPVDFAVSFFNHFHVFGDHRFGPPMEATPYNLQQTLQWNPQCLYLVRGERPYFRPTKYYNVTRDDCEQAAHILETSMDWVGDTNRLSSETLPLLVKLTTESTENEELLAQLKTPSNVASSRKQRNRPLSRNELDVQTTTLIRTSSQLDQWLYQQSVQSLDVQ